MLYRVVQEALNNVARHAQASHVKVKIQKSDDGICVNISDNGRGFRVKRVMDGKRGKRLGLLGMRERLEMVGGRLSVTSNVGKAPLSLHDQPPRRRTS